MPEKRTNQIDLHYSLNEQYVDDITLEFFYKPHSITLLLIVILLMIYLAFTQPSTNNVIENTKVRTAFMPYITSMFMPRAKGDRPAVVPEGCTNLGLVGQFVETNNDVVFTMESSVRTARVAVYSLLNLNKQVPDVYPSQYDIRHLLKATKALNDGAPFVGEGILRKVLKGTYFEHIIPGHGIEEKEERKDSFIQEQMQKFHDWMDHVRGKLNL